MKFIELTDTYGDLTLFNLDHISAIYSARDCTRIVTIDCNNDEHYDVKESVQTIAKRIKAVATLIEKEKELSPIQENISTQIFPTETQSIDDSIWNF